MNLGMGLTLGSQRTGGGAAPTIPLTTKFIKAGTTSFVVPAGLTYIEKVEIIGASGNGSGGAAGTRRGAGGGEYACKFFLPVTPGATIPCQVAAGGSEADTWFSSTSTVLAKPGLNGDNATSPGLGGSGGVGDLLHPGGRGGIPGSSSFSATGGGGAGGPDGPGKSGGNTVASANHGSGGGGCNGNASDRGVQGDTSVGGAGGSGPWNTGGGAAGSSSAGGNGSNGGGGGGAQGTGLSGGNGSQFDLWTDSVSLEVAGPGSGGGGRSGGVGAGVGGNGGGYGGGAGGSSGGTITGQPGLIVLTYRTGVSPPTPMTGPVTLLMAGASTGAIQFTGETATSRFGKTMCGPINWQSRLGDKYLWDFDLRTNAVTPFWQSTDIVAVGGVRWATPGGTSVLAQGAQIASRLAAISGPALVYLAMSRNDLDDGMDGPTWCSNLQTWLTTVTAAMGPDDLCIVEGAWYVDTSDGGTWASGGSARTAIAYMIANMPAICAAFGPRVVLVPLVDRMCLPTGDRNPISGILTDVRHANEIGGLIGWFQLQKMGINPVYITPAAIPSASGSAPAFTGTGGTKGTSVTGNVYDGYTVTLSDTTNTSAVCSQITGPDGQPWQRIVLTVNTPSAVMARVTMEMISTISVTAGQSLTAWCRAIFNRTLVNFTPEYRVFELGGTGSGRSFDSGQMPLATAVAYLNGAGGGAAKLYQNSIDYDLVNHTAPKIMVGVGSGFNGGLVVYANTSGGQSVTIDIARPKFYLV